MTTTPTMVGTPVVASVFPTSTSDVIALPATAVANDLIVLWYTIDPSVAVTTPTGYTLKSTINSRSYGYYKKAVGGETSVTVPIASLASSRVAVTQIWRGVDPATPFGAFLSPVATATNSSAVTAALTNTVANQRLLYCEAALVNSGTTVTAGTPSTYTKLTDDNAGGGFRHLSTGHKDLGATIGSNTVAFSLSASEPEWNEHIWILNPTPDVSASELLTASTATFGIDFSSTPVISGTSTGGGGAPATVLGGAQISFRPAFTATIQFTGGDGLAGDQFYVGSLCEVVVTFNDNRDAATPKDPTTVTLELIDPSGATTTWTYPGTLTRTAAGTYRNDRAIDKTGDYSWYAVGGGAVVAAVEGAFTVKPSKFFPVGP